MSMASSGVTRNRIDARRAKKKSTYNDTRLLHIAGKFCVLRQEAIARVDHVDIVFDSNFDDLVASKVSTDWSVLSSLSNNVCLIGLLPVHAESVFITENSYGVEGKFVGGSEDSCENPLEETSMDDRGLLADWNLAPVGNCRAISRWSRALKGDV